MYCSTTLCTTLYTDYFFFIATLYMDILFQRVLTAEWIDGCKISNVDALKQMGLSLADVRFSDNRDICEINMLTASLNSSVL